MVAFADAGRRRGSPYRSSIASYGRVGFGVRAGLSCALVGYGADALSKALDEVLDAHDALSHEACIFGQVRRALGGFFGVVLADAADAVFAAGHAGRVGCFGKVAADFTPLTLPAAMRSFSQLSSLRLGSNSAGAGARRYARQHAGRLRVLSIVLDFPYGFVHGRLGCRHRRLRVQNITS